MDEELLTSVQDQDTLIYETLRWCTGGGGYHRVGNSTSE